MSWRKEDVGSNSDGWEKEWSEADVEMLKKQMVKNSVGKPGRWEAIAEAFNGKHKMESVIKNQKNWERKKRMMWIHMPNFRRIGSHWIHMLWIGLLDIRDLALFDF
ncbi:hypothetical protein GQ457_10G022880 [Hibiscus cannabinus]